jgi:glycosyltransferase involved in cell wall biosynthesis
MGRSRLAIVIPALNEAYSIEHVIKSASRHGVVIVVDDGSIDATSKIAKINNAVVVCHQATMGYDCALNSGFLKASDLGFDFVITIDADGQHNPDEIEKIYRMLTEGADLVIGRRPKYQRFAEHIFSIITDIVYKVTDPLSGLKGYSISLYKAQGYFDSYGSIGTELTLYALRKGFTVKSLDIHQNPRLGVSRFGSGFKANLKILKALFLGFSIRYLR